MRIVMKFGGSSVGDAAKIRAVAAIIQNAAKEHQVAPVVSAVDGVTEMLLDLADAAAAGNRLEVGRLIAAINDLHRGIARTLDCTSVIEPLLTRLQAIAEGVLALEELTARSRDAIVAHGERLSTAMLAAVLKAKAMDGHAAGIVTDDHFGEADPLMELSMHQVRQTLGPMLDKKDPFVVSGFIAANQHNVTSTLGRGGSDYTATILGTSLKADEIWIYSDVDGLMTADPRTVPSAKLLDHLSFEEAVEMGKFGAKSMHPRALEPAARHRVPVRMRSTFKPQHPGTLISDVVTPGDRMHPVRAVPMLKGLAMVTIGGAAMIGRPGSAAEVFDALAKARVNVHMICQSVSEAGISLVVSAAQVDKARAAIERAARDASLARSMTIMSDLAVVAPLGSGMKGTPGVAARIFAAIAKAGVNVLAIAQGSSELSVSIVVEGKAGPAAVKAVHAEFGLG